MVNRLQARVAAVVAAVALPLAIGACGGGGETRSDEPGASRSRADEVTDKDFDRKNFSNGATVDNKWNPLPPGAQYIFEGRSNRGQGRRPHRVIFTVTDLTKMINGVRTRVLWDRDINGGELLEGELAFHAQDDDGNVWNLGEYPEEYERGEPVRAPDTWIAGLDGARAGILMRASPRVGTPSYLQGRAPRIDFADRARVLKTGERDCVPLGCFEDVLVTDETNPLEPNDGHQRKYYAAGVGNIRAANGPGGKERETLVLVKVRRLSRRALAAVRRQALKLDKRAYAVRKSLYGRTPPAQRTIAGRPAP